MKKKKTLFDVHHKDRTLPIYNRQCPYVLIECLDRQLSLKCPSNVLEMSLWINTPSEAKKMKQNIEILIEQFNFRLGQYQGKESPLFLEYLKNLKRTVDELIAEINKNDNVTPI